MKRLINIFLAAFVLLAISCNNSSDSTTGAKDTVAASDEEETTFPQISEQFPDLFHYFHAQDSGFSERNPEGGPISLRDTVPATPVDKKELTGYYPFLIFNADSSLAIDLVSNNYLLKKQNGKTVLKSGGPDTEASVIDLNKNIRQRILYLGSSGTVLDAKWENDSTILLATAEDIGDNLILPSIWRYHTGDGAYEYFTYGDTIHADISNYATENLNGRNQAR